MNIPFIRQLIGVVGGVALLGGGASWSAAQQGSLAGRVTHRVTQQPVAGAGQMRRELGHSVATIDAAKTVEEAAPTNLADLLNARAPGVQVLPSGGTTGTGSRIRIRGSSSLSLSNEPIIVVDGIRVENGA